MCATVCACSIPAAEGPSSCDPPTWLSRLLSACTDNWESHDHHVTYIAMDTVLTILRMHRELMHSTVFPGKWGERSNTFEVVSCSSSLITGAVFNFVSSNQTFVQVQSSSLNGTHSS